MFTDKFFMPFTGYCFDTDQSLAGDSTVDDDRSNPEPVGDLGDNNGEPNTEYMEFEGVRVPKETFDRLAREQYKDAFDALDNKSKWQAENTRKAQEISDIKRKADAYELLAADPRLSSRQQDDLKTEFVSDIQQQFPDVDPRFLTAMGGWIEKFAGTKASEAVNPIVERQGQAFEREYLSKHPDVVKGSQEYFQISNLIGSGIDAEKAYEITFHDKITKERIETAVKARDEEAKRKLKQRSPSSSNGSAPKSGNFSDHAWDVINKMVG